MKYFTEKIWRTTTFTEHKPSPFINAFLIPDHSFVNLNHYQKLFVSLVVRFDFYCSTISFLRFIYVIQRNVGNSYPVVALGECGVISMAFSASFNAKSYIFVL